jgi:diguanylate cyclase
LTVYRNRESEWFVPGTTSRARRQVRCFALLTVAMAVVAVVVRHDWVVDLSESSAQWSRIVHVAALLAPAFLLVGKARSDAARSTGWRALALGVVCTAYGEALMLYAPERPFPGPTDIAKVLSYLCFAAGVAVLTQRHGDEVRSIRLDGAITGLSLGALVTAIWFEPLANVSGDRLAVGVALAYPLLDVVLLVLIAAGLAPVHYRPTVSALLLSGAAGLLTVSDVTQLGAITVGKPVNTMAADMVIVAVVLFGIAAWSPSRKQALRPSEMLAGLSAVPIVSSLVAIGVLGYGIHAEVNVLALILALAAVSLVIARTAMTVHELRHANDSFRLARTDELTALTNRRGFLEGMERLLAVAPESVAVIVADLNGFKDVNDSLGHHAGDDLLRMVAERFGERLGATSLLARLGGDEFGVVAMVADAGAGLTVAKKLRRTLEDPFEVDGVVVRIGAAFGVAMYPSHGRSRASLLRCADVAMYAAKRSQAGVALYQATIDFNTRTNLELLDELRDAIDQNALSLHYQPKLDFGTGRVGSAEALVRWQHRTKGLLYPDAFVPLAERAGLIPGLTRCVLRQAVAFHAQHFPHMSVSVNISHRDLVDEELARHITELLAEHNFPAGQLTLEITETALANDPERAERSLRQLRAAGLRLSVDDFGVGYSSMARLLDLDVDEVKIDKSFTMAAITDQRAMAIIRSTAQLAAALDLHVVAEGVEQQSIVAELQAAGVHTGQGYFISKPLAQRDYELFLGSAPRPLPPPSSNHTVQTPSLPQRVQTADGSFRGSSLTAGGEAPLIVR